MIWATVRWELDWEPLIRHKPVKQLSDGNDANLILTQARCVADTDEEGCLSQLWLDGLFSASHNCFYCKQKSRLKVFFLKVQVNSVRGNTPKICDINIPPRCSIDCKIIDESSQTSFRVVAVVSAPVEKKSKSFAPLNCTCQYRTADWTCDILGPILFTLFLSRTP